MGLKPHTSIKDEGSKVERDVGGGGGGGSRGILPQESLKSRRSEMSFSPLLMRYFSEKSIS